MMTNEEHDSMAAAFKENVPKNSGPPVSTCCGAAPKNFNNDCDSTDIGICPDCGEHCDFEKENEE